MTIVPIESKSDKRLGWHEADSSIHWPELDVRGQPYQHPASTQAIPKLKGYFVVTHASGSVPLSELEEATAKLRAPAVVEETSAKKKG